MQIRIHYPDKPTAIPMPLREYPAGIALSCPHRAAMLDLENARLREIVCDLLRKNESLRARLAAVTFES